ARAAWPPAPAARTGWDTALVGVVIASAGLAETSWIDVSAGDGSGNASGDVHVRQHLDAGARGLRWVNISPLRAALIGGAALTFETHAATLGPGAVTVRLFWNGVALERPLLVLAPHPDDAEIAAFGLYAQARAATIVTVTAGNAGDANYRDDVPDPAEQYAWKGTLRAMDSVTVPWQGGVPPGRCFNLGYFDARLQAMHDKPLAVVPELYGPNGDVARYRRVNLSTLLPRKSRTATWAHLVEDLRRILVKVRPATIVMPHPILDSHPDHQFVAVAAAEALATWRAPVTLLLYTNHAAENLYPYGPADTDVGLPPLQARDLDVQRVYSHPVDRELRRRKLYALEAMHDLRLSPAEQSCPPGARRPDYPRIPEVDYFRRAPRPEELFFAYDRRGLADLVRDFLAHPPPPDEP
ncbi:MAG TPA: PIG-L family deacetylase, partial [Polyangia bacterium]|nr:PIG-L family deacetylase [Polyangia bacterium]